VQNRKKLSSSKRGKSVQPPPPCPNIERVSSLITATGHVDNLLSASTDLMYALRVLLSHGIPPASLHDVFRATVVYCSPARSGMCSAEDRARLDSASDSASATRTYRQRLSCLAMLMMLSLNELTLTRNTYSNATYLIGLDPHYIV